MVTNGFKMPVSDQERRLVRGREVDAEPEPRVLVRAQQDERYRLQSQSARRRVLGGTNEIQLFTTRMRVCQAGPQRGDGALVIEGAWSTVKVNDSLACPLVKN